MLWSEIKARLNSVSGCSHGKEYNLNDNGLNSEMLNDSNERESILARKTIVLKVHEQIQICT